MHEVLINRLGGLGLPKKSVVRLTDRRDMNLDDYRVRKTTTQLINRSRRQTDVTDLPVEKKKKINK